MGFIFKVECLLFYHYFSLNEDAFCSLSPFLAYSLSCLLPLSKAPASFLLSLLSKALSRLDLICSSLFNMVSSLAFRFCPLVLPPLVPFRPLSPSSFYTSAHLSPTPLLPTSCFPLLSLYPPPLFSRLPHAALTPNTSVLRHFVPSVMALGK